MDSANVSAATEACLLLVHSAEQLVCIVDRRQHILKGAEMNNIVILQRRNMDGLSVVVGMDGLISDLGYDSDVRPKYHGVHFDSIIDASGKCVLPGLIDGHTHPVWAGDRVDEFAMKVAGASYMEIHRAGGGIHFTVEHTRRASFEELYHSLEQWLWRMLKCGTTVAECKSGYGLEPETEMKMLRVLEKAKQNLPIDISITYCGAHAIPKGMSAADATLAVLHQQLPLVQQGMKRSEWKVENIDVFCEEGVFDVEQSRQILTAGQQMGLAINFHGDELHPMNSAVMGAELGARAISHLEEVSEEGIAAMAEKDVVAVVLPTTAYVLRLKAPPVRRMIDEGVPVALGTDFNPNAFCLSMPLTMHLACVLFRMTMSEALVAATLNAAASVGRSAFNGSLERGKRGDLIILSEPRWEHLIYQMAAQDHIIKYVIKNGKVVVAN